MWGNSPARADVISHAWSVCVSRHRAGVSVCLETPTSSTWGSRSFGLAVQELRRRRGITQGDLSTTAGLHRSYLSAPEHGAYDARNSLLVRDADLVVAVVDLARPSGETVSAMAKVAAVGKPMVQVDVISGPDQAATWQAGRLMRHGIEDRSQPSRFSPGVTIWTSPSG